jgi:hypothetical protein
MPAVQAEALVHAHHREELARLLMTQLKIVMLDDKQAATMGIAGARLDHGIRAGSASGPVALDSSRSSTMVGLNDGTKAASKNATNTQLSDDLSVLSIVALKDVLNDNGGTSGGSASASDGGVVASVVSLDGDNIGLGPLNGRSSGSAVGAVASTMAAAITLEGGSGSGCGVDGLVESSSHLGATAIRVQKSILKQINGNATTEAASAVSTVQASEAMGDSASGGVAASGMDNVGAQWSTTVGKLPDDTSRRSVHDGGHGLSSSGQLTAVLETTLFETMQSLIISVDGDSRSDWWVSRTNSGIRF